MEVWSVLQGTGISYRIYLEDPQTGAPYSGYSGQDVLSAEIWAGDNQEVLAVPIVSWLDAAGGELLVSIGSNISATLEPGRYKLAVYVILLESGERAEVETVWLDVTESAGLGVVIPTYCSYDDLCRECGDIQRLQDVEDQVGYREQRGMARDWTDGLIQAAYTGCPWVRGDFSIEHLIPGWVRNRAGDDPLLQAWLDADRLVLTGPSGARIRRANALYALSLIYGSQLVKEGDTNPYGKLAAKFLQTANSLMSSTVVRVDTSDAGDGNSASLRRIGRLGVMGR